jgi:hypothetical protein
MKAIAAALILALSAAPLAEASSTPKAKEGPVAPYVTLNPVALPVVANGRVVNYVFVTLRVELNPGTPAAVIDAARTREPFFRDALVRSAHRTPFTVAGDYTMVDETKLKSAFLTDARAIGGPAVVSVRVMMQTPKSLRVSASR